MNGLAPYIIAGVTIVAGVLAYLWRVRGAEMAALKADLERLHKDCHQLELLLTRLEERTEAVKRHRRAGDE